MTGDPTSPCVTTWPEIPAEDVRHGVVRRAFGNAEVMLVLNEIAPAMTPAPHQHDFDQIALILSGRATYHVGEEANEVGPGSVLLIPAGVEHWIEPVGDAPVENLDVFAPPRADFQHLVAWMGGVSGSGDA